MVRVAPVHEIYVQVQPTVGHESLEKIFEQPEVEGFDFPIRQIDVVDQKWPATQIHRDLCQGFVERGRGKPESFDPRFLSQRLMQSLSHHNTDIFHRVMFIDVDVAFRLHGQIEKPVLCQQLQHVVEETDAGGDLALSRPVQKPLNLDIGFLRRSMQ